MTKRRQDLGPTAVQVAKNVRRIRQSQGVTLKRLAEKTGLSLDAIKKIEAGANPDTLVVRRVDVDELMILAIALSVNPSALLLPDHLWGEVEVTGRSPVSADVAWAWADGKQPLANAPDEKEMAAFVVNARPRHQRDIPKETQ